MRMWLLIICLVVPQGYVATRMPNWLADSVARKGGQNIRARYFKRQAKAKAN